MSSEDFDSGYAGYATGYNTGYEVALDGARLLFAKYLKTEGCGCCEAEEHYDIRNELAALLGMPRYADDSGVDYGKVLGERDDDIDATFGSVTTDTEE